MGVPLTPLFCENIKRREKKKIMAVIHIVGTRCQAEVEDRFNKWYDEVHIPMLLKFKGLKKATRYKILKPREDYPEYVAIYEFESREAFEDYEKSPEMSAAIAEMKETWKDGGWEMVWRVQYEQRKEGTPIKS